MRHNRKLLFLRRLAAAVVLLPLLQGAGCVVDPQQFASFVSSQMYQLWANGFQNGIGLLLDKWLIWSNF